MGVEIKANAVESIFQLSDFP